MVSLLAIGTLILAAFSLALYIDSTDNYPGDLLIWVANYRVISALIFFSLLMFLRSVREDGSKLWQKLLDIATKKFEAL